MMDIKKVYIAGPMQNYPNYNFGAFDTAKMWLERFGYEVVSPADIDREFGLSENTPVEEIDWPEIVRRDTKAVIQVDAVVVLPGWQLSTGALWEVALCRFLHKPVLDYGVLIDAIMDKAGG